MRTQGSGLTVLPVRLLTVTISPPSSSSSAILVVDDDPLVRAVTVDALEDEGFKVLEAPTADYAARVRESRSGIGLVFTDVILPGALNGFDLARLVQRGTRTSLSWSHREPCPTGSAARPPVRASCPSPGAWPRSCRSSAGCWRTLCHCLPRRRPQRRPLPGHALQPKDQAPPEVAGTHG
jgi:CheY-like chemotaxis protein